MSRYDRMAMHMPWHDPAFRQAARTHQQTEKFLNLCKQADARGKELSPTQKRLRATLEHQGSRNGEENALDTPRVGDVPSVNATPVEKDSR